ncbi:MAG: hypothetical protein M3Y77_13450 [Actinomycetota bacterium]|nr:hypothetical protein [Actinomycetota bacterium]
MIVVAAPPLPAAVPAPDDAPLLAAELVGLAAPVAAPLAGVLTAAEPAALDATGAADPAAPFDVGVVFALLLPQAVSASVAVTAAVAKERSFIVLPGLMTLCAVESGDPKRRWSGQVPRIYRELSFARRR